MTSKRNLDRIAEDSVQRQTNRNVEAENYEGEDQTTDRKLTISASMLKAISDW
jgi:hypothetical protein